MELGAIVIRLAPGQELGDHQVHERAWLTVIQGSAHVEAGQSVVEAEPGTLLTFEPRERHSVASERQAPRSSSSLHRGRGQVTTRPTIPPNSFRRLALRRTAASRVVMWKGREVAALFLLTARIAGRFRSTVRQATSM